MVIYTWWEIVYFYFLIGAGLLAMFLSIILFRLDTWDKWYILFKGGYGLYMTVVFYLILTPQYLNDPWVARQCVRGVVILAALTLILDMSLRWNRRRLQ